MKILFVFVILLESVSTLAHADELLCASKKDQTIYFSQGQVLVKGELNSPTLLSMVSMKVTGGSNLGAIEDELKGKVKGNWVRFQFSDAWCDYTATLPKDFMISRSVPMFLDARCEENTNSTIKLFCKIQ